MSEPEIIKFAPATPSGVTCQTCAWWVRETYSAPVKGQSRRLASPKTTDLGICRRLRILNLTLTPATGHPLTDAQPMPITLATFSCNNYEMEISER